MRHQGTYSPGSQSRHRAVNSNERTARICGNRNIAPQWPVPVQLVLRVPDQLPRLGIEYDDGE